MPARRRASRRHTQNGPPQGEARSCFHSERDKTLFIVALIIALPVSAAARFWATGIGGLIAVAALVAGLASVTVLLLSFHYSLPSGPAIILVAGIAYVISLIFGPAGGVIAQLMPRRVVPAQAP